jgi:hypothetical protein
MRKVILVCLIIISATSLLILSLANAKGNSVPPIESSDNASEIQTVFIHNIDEINGIASITADEVLWFEGAEADKQFVAHEKDAGMEQAPDGYYLINDSPQLHTLEVSKNAVVLMQIYDRPGDSKSPELVPNEKVTLSQFIAFFKKNEVLDLKDYPFHLTIQQGKIIKIVQQFIP